jgi:hypothetical protein
MGNLRAASAASQALLPSWAVRQPSAAGEGSGQTPRDTEQRDTDSRGMGDSSQVSAVSPTVKHTHADAPNPRLA